jgi:hypothetical protein
MVFFMPAETAEPENKKKNLNSGAEKQTAPDRRRDTKKHHP